MSKVFFAIVLVAASFAGGAVVNGPGLRWVRDMILNQPGTEIATTTLTDPPVGEVAPVEEIPAAPIPRLVIPPAPSEPAAAAPAAPPAPQPKTPEAPATPPAASTPVALATSRAPAPDAPPPPDVSNAKDQGVLPAPPPPPRPLAAAAPIDPEVTLANLPTDSGPPPPPSPSAASGPADWPAVAEKMRALGVARYGIEGEPTGRVRFHCVIPLAGRRAVGQQFEAEADDPIEAAQTALRRVALWRATEHPSPSPSP